MLENGWDDVMICNHLGMEADEIVRLKHITGFSKLFNDTIVIKTDSYYKDNIFIKFLSIFQYDIYDRPISLKKS